jgi:hypothetical protein
LRTRFVEAVTELTAGVEAEGINIEDADTDAEVRRWLNGAERRVDWAGPGVTPDDWFFVTTFYGAMNLDGQRTHILKFFPYFVSQTNRDVRNFTSTMLADWRLRQPWSIDLRGIWAIRTKPAAETPQSSRGGHTGVVKDHTFRRRSILADER